MNFVELPAFAKKEFLNMKDMTKEIEAEINNWILEHKHIIFDNSTTHTKFDNRWFYDNGIWYLLKKDVGASFSYQKIDDEGIKDCIVPFGKYAEKGCGNLTRYSKSFFIRNEKNELFIFSDNYILNFQNGKIEILRDPSCIEFIKENIDKIKRKLLFVKNFNIVLDDIEMEDRPINRTFLCNCYFKLNENPKIKEAFKKYDLGQYIFSETEFKTALTFFDKNGDLNIPSWLIKSIRKYNILNIKKYSLWIKRYHLDENAFQKIENFLKHLNSNDTNKINSILNCKDSNKKEYYNVNDLVKYIKEQVMDNFISEIEAITMLYEIIKIQNEKYSKINILYPEDLPKYFEYLNKVKNNNQYVISDQIYKNEKFILNKSSYDEDSLKYLTEISQKNILNYSINFIEPIFTIDTVNDVVAIFTVDSDGNVDEIFYNSINDDEFTSFMEESNKTLKNFLKK